MRRRFCPNRIFEGLTSQNRYTCLKFSSKWKHSALFMKIVQKALFRSCAARFGQIAFLSVKVVKIVTLAWNSLQNGKTVRFPWKLYRMLFSGDAQHVLAKSNLWASKFLKSSHWPETLFKTEKQNAFHKNSTKRSFQVMRSTFWPNRICERQSSQNSHTGLKFSPKRKKGALFMKIVQNALFRSCAARFGEIKLVSVKLLKIVTLVPNSFQNGKTVRFSWKLYKTLFSGHAEHVYRHTGLKFSPKRANSALFMKIVGHAQHVLAKSHFWASKLSIRHTGLKFSSKRPNSALSMKIVPNARFRSYAARFGQIAFVSVKVVKIVTLAVNSLQKGKTVRFPWKLYKTLFSGHAQHVFAKSNLWASKLSKSSHWPQSLSRKGKQCAFHENCTKPFFRVMRSTIWRNRIFYCQSSQNRETRLKVSSKRKNSALSMKIEQNALFRSCAEVLPKSYFWGSNFSKSLHLSQILFKTGKQCAFHENCTKRSFQVMRSTFWPNPILERQRCQNRQTGLKSSSERENSALFIKIVQNARFRSCAGGFAQIAFLRVKLLKIVTLVSNTLKNGKTVRFSWKLYKTLFLGHAQLVLPKSNLWASKFSKSSHWPQILSKKAKQCAFYEN